MKQDTRTTAAAKEIEIALAGTQGWALRAAASTVGIERDMTTPEIIAYWLATKALNAADAVDSEIAATLRSTAVAMRDAVMSQFSHHTLADETVRTIMRFEDALFAFDRQSEPKGGNDGN